jgi:NAD(P)-dependent dehydrogenase (short-subunit alcohol dehydrogenase family)
VTGGGTGIGAALVTALVAGGCQVIAVGRRAEPLADVAAKHGAAVTTVQADVAAADGIRRIADAVVAAGGDVSYLVHNAGVLGPIKPLAAVQPDEWRAVMATNVDAPLFLTQALLPYMKSGARVLHIGSGAASRPIGGWGSYCVSKSALQMVYRVLAQELAPAGACGPPMRGAMWGDGGGCSIAGPTPSMAVFGGAAVL